MKLFGSRTPARSPLRRPTRAILLEAVEPRLLYAALSWTGSAGDNKWNTASNWSSSTVPTSADTVTINTTATVLIEGIAASAVSVSTNANIAIGGSGYLTLFGGNLALSAGATISLGKADYTSYGQLFFGGSNISGGQTVSGTGSIVANYGNIQNQIFLTANPTGISPAARVVFAPGISIASANTSFNGTYAYDSFLLQGTLTVAPPAANASSTPTTTVNTNFINQNAITINGSTTLNFITGLQNIGTIAPATITVNNANLNLSGSWTQQGTLTATDSTVSFGGSFTQSSIGNFNRTRGTVNITGILNSSLALTDTTGSYTLASGGSLFRGTYSATGAARLIANGGTLDGYTVASDVDVSTISGATLTIVGGLTLSNNATIKIGSPDQSTYGSIYFTGTDVSGGQVVSGTGNIAINNGYLYNYLNRSSGTAPAVNTQVTFGPSISLTAAYATLSYAYGLFDTFLLQGNFSAPVSGATTTIYAPFSNAGTINVDNKAIVNFNDSLINTSGHVVNVSNATLSMAGAWTNAGSIVALDSTVSFGGTFTQAAIGSFSRTGGVVNITGILSGGLALSTATGNYTLASGGVLDGGTYSATGTSQLIITNGTFKNLTVASNVDGFTTGATLYINGNLTLANNAAVILGDSSFLTYAYVYFQGTDVAGGITVGGTGSFLINYGTLANYLQRSSASAPASTTQVVFAPGVSISGANATFTYGYDLYDTFLLQSGLTAATSGTNFSINAPLTNQGTISVINRATLTFTNALINPAGHSVTVANSTLTLAGSWTNQGTITTTDSTVNFGGSFTQADIGTVNRSGGVINITGILKGNLALSDTTGAYVLASGGKLTTGTYSASGAARLQVISGYLDNYTVASDVDCFSSSGTLYVVTSLTLANNASITLGKTDFSTNSYLYFQGNDLAGGLTVAGTGSIVVDYGGIYNLLSRSSTNAPSSTTQVVLGTGISVTSRNATIGYYYDTYETFLLQGTFTALDSTTTITALFRNEGSISASSNATLTFQNALINPAGMTVTITDSILSLAGSWTNSGSLVATNSTVNFGGSFVQSAIGDFTRNNTVVNINGIVNGGLTLSDATGSYNLTSGGVLKGGVYSATGSAHLTIITGTFDNLTVASDVDAASTYGTLYINHDLTLANNAAITFGNSDFSTYSYAYFLGTDLTGGATVSGTGSLNFNYGGFYNALGRSSTNVADSSIQVLIGPGINISAISASFYNSDVAANLRLQGTFSASTPQSSPVISLPLLNEGSLSVTGGATLRVGNLLNYDALSSTLTGGSYLVGDGSTLELAGVNIGNLAATFTLAGANAQVYSDANLYYDQTNAFAGDLNITGSGTLILQHGKSLTLPSLSNAGTLALDSDSHIGIANAFANTGTVLTTLSTNSTVGSLTSGSATVGGVLQVQLAPGVDPAGNTYTFLTSPSISGTFATVTSPNNSVTASYPGSFVLLSGGPPLVPSTNPPSVPDLDAASDSGSSNSDNYTNDNTPTFIGTTDPNTAVFIYVDGVSAGSTTSDASGNYSFTIPNVSPLADGHYGITAQTAASTNLGSLAITIDTAAPVINAPTLLTYPATTTAGGVVNYSCIALDAFDSAPTYAYSLPPGTLFAVGSTPVSVTASDLAGNSASTSFSITVTPPPTIGGVDPSFGLGGSGTIITTIANTIITSLDSFTLAGGLLLTAGLDSTTNQLVLSHFNADGTLDTTYGTAGILRVALPANFTPNRVQFDAATGNIYFLGTATDTAQPIAIRLSQGGDIDASFGTAGILTLTPFVAGDRVDAILPVKGGFLVGGAMIRGGVRTATIVMLTTAGAQNLKYGTKGSFTITTSHGSLDTIGAIVLGPKNTIFATGTVSSGNVNDNSATSSILTLKLTTAGKLDKSFGQRTTSISGYALASGQKLLVQSDGKVDVAATIATSAATAGQSLFGSVLVRYTAKGTLDPTFNGSGFLVVSTPPAPVANNFAAAFRSDADVPPQLADTAAQPLENFLDNASASVVQVGGGKLRNLAASSNNTDTTLTQTQIVADAIDLVVKSLTVPTKMTVKPKAKLAATFALSNAGTLPTAASAPVAFYLSTDGTLDLNTDMALPAQTAKLGMKAGTSKSVKLTIPLPQSITSGSFFVFAIFNNNAAAFSELTLANNTMHSTAAFTVSTGKVVKAPVITASITASLFATVPILG